MADTFSLCLTAAMDHLWFHHIILISEPTSLLVSKTLKPTSSTLSLSSPLDDQEISSPLGDDEKSSDSSSSSLEDEEKSSDSSSSPLEDEQKSSASSPDDYNNEEEEEEKKKDVKERPTRLNHLRARTRSQSSSPSTQKRPINRKYLTSKLQKSMSCRSLVDLELEELKGFMDLGFRFNEEYLSPRMMSIVPGLQRAKLHNNKENGKTAREDDKIEQEEEDYKKGIMRPYLSEAWLIKRPDSPLLNLKILRATAAADMKKHLRFWAKTVASTVQQEMSTQKIILAH